MDNHIRLQCSLVFIGLLMFGSSVSMAAVRPDALPENPVGGSVLFVEKMCIRCHAIQGYGGTRGPDLARLRLKGGFLGMAGIMWNHAPKMISTFAEERLPYPKFTVREMTQLVAFLYSLNYLDPVGNVREGEDAFNSKRCIHCHSVGNKGGRISPSLDQFGRFASPLYVATALWNKGPEMAKVMQREKIPRPTLTGRDVRNIVAFIQARSSIYPAPESLLPIFVRPGNPRKGALIFKAKGCPRCHSVNGTKSGEGPALSGLDLKVSFSDIASRMWNHSPEMWALRRKKGMAPSSFAVDEMADVTAYLYFLQFESPKGDPSRGANLFIEQGCAGCHNTGEKGRRIGPDLRTKGPWESDIDLAREMWNHAGNMYGSLFSSAREWPKLSEKQVADLLAYVRSTAGTKK